MAKTKQLNVRIPSITQDQLAQIEKKTGMTLEHCPGSFQGLSEGLLDQERG